MSGSNPKHNNKDTRLLRKKTSKRTKSPATSHRHKRLEDRVYAQALERYKGIEKDDVETFEPTSERPGYISYASRMPAGTASEHRPSPYSKDGYGAAAPVVGATRYKTDKDRPSVKDQKPGLLQNFVEPASPNKAPMPSGISRSARRLSARYSQKGPFRVIIPALLLIMLAAILGLAAAGVLFVQSSLSTLPAVDSKSLNDYAETGITTIYANDGETVLAKVYTVNRIQVDSDKISQYIKDATVATEDARFYDHSGVDPVGVARAIASTIGGWQQGGSTITQQLIRNTVLLNEMNDISFERKIREMALAMEVEEMYSKDEILSLYLNIVNYGDGCYGIEAAARDYFGCSADELTLSQAALIAGIPQSPNYYNPRENYDAALERRAIVLAAMLREHYITQEEYDEVIDDEPELAENKGFSDEVSESAPYFVDYVKEILAEGENATQPIPASITEKGGLSIVTTLDPACQQAANNAVDGVMDSYEGMEAALASVDPETGEIVAMYGGRSYSEDQFNLATQMSRQAGSSFKPFALVAALQEGVSPNYIKLPAKGPIYIGEWRVDNSDGEGSGDVNIADATAYSYNTVYAMLTHGIGPDKVAATAHAMGIESNLSAVDSICLGTQGINPLEMASAYGTLATGGIRHSPVAILSIKDSAGDTLYEYDAEAEGERVLSDGIARDATEILKTVLTKGTGTGGRLSSGQTAAGKTGTSENGRDMWFVGYTPQLSTAVWTGYRDDTPTYMYGSTTSTPIWRDYMNAALEGEELEDFPGADSDPTYYTDWDFTSFVK